MSAAGLFAELKRRCAADWDAYVRHDFVRRLGDGSLPEPCFAHYLKQDYLFLIHFARAYGLAAYKSTSLRDIRQAKDALAQIVDVEIGLHVKFCAGWGISEDDLAQVPEEPATLAYTRYVLERGMAGTLLDLHVALAPCMIGYAEIATWLMAQNFTRLDGNPYREWIEMYADPAYQAAATAEQAELDRLYESDSGTGRLADLGNTFGEATRLEIAFWQMGLSAAP